MKAPVLLDGHTMNRKAALKPISLGIRWTIDGLSSASMKLDETSAELTLKDWVLITAPNGDSAVFYVKTIKENKPSGIIDVTLEHAFGLLQEMIVFGEIKPSTMGGSETQVNLETAIRYMLQQQTENLWQLGGTDFSTEAQGWKFTHSTIYAALNNMAEAVLDCQWEFDMSSLPWKLYLKSVPDSATMEMRMNRNIESIRMTVDRSRMITRIYPTGKNDLHIAGNYLEKNTAEYGIISQVVTDSSISDEGHLRAWARKMLNENCNPAVSVSISGADLSQATGESLDKIVIGRKCRVPLPEYGTTVTERVVELSWKDCVADEETVTVTLANELTTIQGVLYEIATGTGSSGSRSGGGGGKSNREHDCELGDQEAHLEEFDNADIWINRDSVWAVAASYDVYYDGQGNKFLRVKDGAALEVDRNGVYETVGTSQQISEVDGKVTNTIMGSALWTQRDNITGVCGEYDVIVDQTTGERTLVIKSGGGMKIRRNNVEYGIYDDGTLTGGVVATKLNDGTVQTDIPGSIISIGSAGSATTVINSLTTQVNNLEAVAITTTNLTTQIANAGAINVSSLNVSGNAVVSGAVIGSGLYIGGSGSNTDVGNAISGIGVATEASGEITIPTTKLNGNQGPPINFNIAATQYFIDGVAANRASDVGSVQTTDDTAIQLLDQYNTKYKIQTRYKTYGGSWSNGSSYVILTPVDRYQTGFDEGNAHRGSDVGSVSETSDTAIQSLSSYNTKYKIQTRYQKADGTWANGSSYVVLTPVDRYQTGYNAGAPVSASLGSKTSRTGIYYNVLVNKGDGGQQAFEVDLSAAYTAARTGYTLGTFTLATVTPQGTAYGDITPVGQAVTPTTYNVTLQGSEVTVYERHTTAYKTSTLGYYPRGSKYSGTLYTNGTTKYTGDLYYGGNYTEVTVVGGSPGSGVNLYKSAGTGTYRKSGSPATYYDVGSSTKLYKAGTKITGLRNPGTAVSDTYYTKS